MCAVPRAIAEGSSLLSSPIRIDDQFTVSVNGSSLTGTDGGGGGAVSWIRENANFSTGLGGEYETLGDAHWGFGSISAAVVPQSSSHGNFSVSGEIDYGGGVSGAPGIGGHFAYDAATVDARLALRDDVSVQVTDRQVDIDAVHGNLPTISFGAAYAFWYLSGSYTRSATGNLGTEIASLRLDCRGQRFGIFGGLSTGKTSPALTSVGSGTVLSSSRYRGASVGMSTWRTQRQYSLVFDYVSVGAIKSATLTLTWSFGAPPNH